MKLTNKRHDRDSEEASAKTQSPARLILFLILAAALGVRVWGIGWGLPSATHYFSYHPDETAVLFYAMNMNAFAGKLLPHFYNYGSLQLYLILFANSIAYLANAVNINLHDFSQDWGAWARMTLIGRLLAVGMGTWTVGLTYGIGARLWNRRAGLIAAALLAVMPLHAQHSHWLTVDVPATFWIMLAVYWAVRLSTLHENPEQSRWRMLRPAVYAGLAAGLATATKYNAVLVLLPVIHAAWPTRRGTAAGPSIKQASVWVGAALVSFAIAFIVACPGCLLETGKFVHDIAFEAKHVGAQADEPFRNTGNGFLYQITTNLFYGMGWPLLIVALGSLVYAAVKRERQDGLLAVFAVPYYALIGFAVVRYARYAIPLLPFLALWTGRMLSDLTTAERIPVRQSGLALTGATLAATVFFGFQYVAPMACVDPRDQAVDYLTAKGLRDAPVGFATMPWFQTPPIEPTFGWLGYGGWRSLPYNSADWQSRIVYHNKDWDMSILDVDRPAVVLLSQYDYKDAIRLGKPDAKAFLAKLRQEYRVGAEFGGVGRPEIGPVGPPHDMMYSNPATWVFVRK